MCKTQIRKVLNEKFQSADTFIPDIRSFYSKMRDIWDYSFDFKLHKVHAYCREGLAKEYSELIKDDTSAQKLFDEFCSQEFENFKDEMMPIPWRKLFPSIGTSSKRVTKWKKSLGDFSINTFSEFITRRAMEDIYNWPPDWYLREIICYVLKHEDCTPEALKTFMVETLACEEVIDYESFDLDEVVDDIASYPDDYYVGYKSASRVKHYIESFMEHQLEYFKEFLDEKKTVTLSDYNG